MQRLLAAAAVLAFTGTAQAAIINGQFTATIDGGNVRVFNPDFTVASDTPIAPGTSFNGTFRIDTSLLPMGVTTTTGGTTFFQDLTRHLQSGGAQWLTAEATLGLAAPLSFSFGRDPAVPKPPGAIHPPGGFDPPAFSQDFNYGRGTLVGFGQCCDSFGIGLDNFDIWSLPGAGDFVSYRRVLEFGVIEGQPRLLDPATGLPDNASFVDKGEEDGFDDTSGSGQFTVADFITQDSVTSPGRLISGEFTVLTASFITVTEVPAPGASLLLIGAFLLRAARRQRAG
jgi:hypothetical protein